MLVKLTWPRKPLIPMDETTFMEGHVFCTENTCIQETRLYAKMNNWPRPPESPGGLLLDTKISTLIDTTPALLC